MIPILRVKDKDGNNIPILAIQGEKGYKGDNGLTPHIGENYTWWIGETDTGVNVQSYEYGSYVGTGTYGTDNPNSLTFSFIPKLVVIIGKNTGDQMILINGIAYGLSHYTYNSIDYLQARSSTPSNHNSVTWNGNTVEWYSTTYENGAFMGANLQLNGFYYKYNNGRYGGYSEKYYYIAIG